MFWSSERSRDRMWYHLLWTNAWAAWNGGMYVYVGDGDGVDVTASSGGNGLPGALLGDVSDM